MRKSSTRVPSGTGRGKLPKIFSSRLWIVLSVIDYPWAALLLYVGRLPFQLDSPSSTVLSPNCHEVFVPLVIKLQLAASYSVFSKPKPTFP